MYTLDQDGYFRSDGRRFVPTGVNYWPGSCGVEMWQAWPADEIRRDLDITAALGLNTVRFFLRWQDFEPEPGAYVDENFARLAELVAWCGERGLAAHPSLFVGFMSGGIFWPTWKGGRNLFADDDVRGRAVAFARRAARAMTSQRRHILAVDQGNELCCLPESYAASPAAVSRWCGEINAAVRAELPDMVMISGNEQAQVIGDSGWRLNSQPGCDLLSMHAYPVEAWNSIAFDGMTDPLMQGLLPFYAAVARAFRPVFAQEFGTIVTFSRDHQERYLAGMLPRLWESGANGFLWWCLRDIDARCHPYLKCGFEGTLGLVDAAGRVKPGLEGFIAFARTLDERPAPLRDEPTALYFPKHYWNRDEPANPGNDPRALSRRMIIADHLLRLAGERVRVVRGDQPLSAGIRRIVVAGALLAVDEAEALSAWVAAGGDLILHGVDPMGWGAAYRRLLGAVPAQYRHARSVTVEAFGGRWQMGSWPRGMRCEVVPETAAVLARDEHGLPVVLRNRVGSGRCTWALAQVDDAAADVSGDPAARDRWVGWYRGMLAE